MMSTVLRAAEFLCLSLWLGGDVFLSFVVAPGAFAVLGSRDLAGTMVGYALARLHILGIVFGLLFFLFRLLRSRSFAAFTSPAALAVLLMLALTAGSQFAVSRRLAALRTEMGSVDRTPLENPFRVEFDRLHKISVRLEGGVLLAGLTALYFLTREVSQP